MKLPCATHLLIFCKTEGEAHNAEYAAEKILEEELKLSLNREKTQVLDARKRRGNFLGFAFSAKYLAPSEKAIERYKDAIRHKTRRQQPKNVGMVIASINPIIRGWGRYFGYRTSPTPFTMLDAWTRARVRSFKAKRRGDLVIRRPLPEESNLVSLVSLRTDSPATRQGDFQTRAVCPKRARTVR